LQLAIIGRFLEGEVFETAEIRLMLFQNSLINSSGLRKTFRPLAKNNLLSPLLEDAIKRLFKYKNTGISSLSFWFVRDKRRGPFPSVFSCRFSPYRMSADLPVQHANATLNKKMQSLKRHGSGCSKMNNK